MTPSLHPAPDRRMAALSVLAAASVHAAAIWLAWSVGGTPVTTSPIPLEVRFVVDAAPRASAPVSAPAPTPPQPPPPQPEHRPPPPRPQPVRVPRAAPPRAPAPVLTAETPQAAPELPAAPVAAQPAPAPEPVSAPAAPAVAAAPPVAAAPAASVAGPVVSAPRFDAAYLANPPPTYPVLSRRMGEEGKVMLRVHVEPDGRPSQVELRNTSGFQRLDDAALRAVRGWRFVPARRGDEAVAAWVLVPINFTLKTS